MSLLHQNLSILLAGWMFPWEGLLCESFTTFACGQLSRLPSYVCVFVEIFVCTVR